MHDMTKLLYWLLYHCDLGPFGPRVMDMALQGWFKRQARAERPSFWASLTRHEPEKTGLNFGK